MGEAQVIEGTTEEIMARLRDAYPEQNLRVTVEPQEEEPVVDWSAYPHTVTIEEQRKPESTGAPRFDAVRRTEVKTRGNEFLSLPRAVLRTREQNEK